MNNILQSFTRKFDNTKSIILVPFSYARNFVGFGKHGQEYEQAIIRLVIISLIMMYLVMVNLATKYQLLQQTIFVFWCIYFFLTISLLGHIKKYPQPSPNRKLLTLFMDISATSYSVYLTSEISSVFIGVYLWLIIGYGLRYGKRTLVTAYLLSLVGFFTAAMYSSYWQSHILIFYGLFVTLIAVPLHTLRLFIRLQEAMHKAEMANKAKSQFLSHISHEIRTPLNGILGACELLDDGSIKKDQKILFTGMKSSAELLMQLVNNVLDLSKIESGKTSSFIQEFNLKDLMDNVVNIFQNQAQQKGILITHEINGETPLFLRGEFLHIKQVLINLVANAVKFTEQGTVKVNIDVLSQNQTQAKIRFEIIDTGIGIEIESLSTIFESFTQANESIKYQFGGTGLGTTISKNLVEFMGGNIGVESERGQGSKFWFEIQLDKLSANSSISNKDNTSSEIIPFGRYQIQSDKQKKSYKILVAEDNEINSMIISKALEKENHRVELVKNGVEALDKLEHTHYDIMIFDSNMPVMGGLEAIRIYKALNIGAPQSPTIILSADATVESINATKEVGVNAYLTKPIQFDILFQTINRLISQSAKSAEIIEYNSNVRTDSQTSSSLLNLERLNDLGKLGQNTGFIEALIKDFVADTDQRMSLLDDFVTKLDYLNINASGHTIAGAASNMGANELVKICQEIDNIKPSDDMIYIQSLLKKAKNTYEKTKVQLLDYPKQPGNSHQIPK